MTLMLLSEARSEKSWPGEPKPGTQCSLSHQSVPVTRSCALLTPGRIIQLANNDAWSRETRRLMAALFINRRCENISLFCSLHPISVKCFHSVGGCNPDLSNVEWNYNANFPFIIGRFQTLSRRFQSIYRFKVNCHTARKNYDNLCSPRMKDAEMQTVNILCVNSINSNCHLYSLSLSVCRGDVCVTRWHPGDVIVTGWDWGNILLAQSLFDRRGVRESLFSINFFTAS